jgi:hypothetical protein
MTAEQRKDTTTLWRPTGPEELALVEASGWRAWPPRLPEQPIFYPVLNFRITRSALPGTGTCPPPEWAT